MELSEFLTGAINYLLVIDSEQDRKNVVFPEEVMSHTECNYILLCLREQSCMRPSSLGISC